MEDNYDIQCLTETKSFEDLTVEEKSMILRNITAEEYSARRKIVQNVQLFLKGGIDRTKPKKDTKVAVAAIMKAKREEGETNILEKIFAYKIPAYATAIAIALLIFILPFFYIDSEKKIIIADVKEIKPVIIYKTDTIAVEKEVLKYVKVTKIKYVKEIKHSDGINPGDLMEESSMQQFSDPASMSINTDQLENQMKNIGKPNSEQEELNKFLVVSK